MSGAKEEPPADSAVTSEPDIKIQKKNVQSLYKQLKVYTECYRKFLAARRNFCNCLDQLYEPNWVAKNEFTNWLAELAKIGDSGATRLEKAPMEETVVYMDQFGPVEKDIKIYKDKLRQCQDAEKKVQNYSKKKNASPDEMRKLHNILHEKKTSLKILHNKLRDELPKFYNSRMDFYAKFWKSIFDIQSDIAREEQESFSNLLRTVDHFGLKRQEGAYDSHEFDVGEDDYAVEGDMEPFEATQQSAASGISRSSSFSPSESSFYAVVNKSNKSNQSNKSNRSYESRKSSASCQDSEQRDEAEGEEEEHAPAAEAAKTGRHLVLPPVPPPLPPPVPAGVTGGVPVVVPFGRQLVPPRVPQKPPGLKLQADAADEN